MTPAEKFLSRLSWHKRTGQGRYIARCPSHKDRSPSLSISEKEDSSLLIYCHAACGIDEIVGALGLELSDLFPPRPKADSNRPRNDFYREKERRAALDAADILTTSAGEMIYAYIVMRDHHEYLKDPLKGQPPGPDTRARFLKATERLLSAANRATGRNINVDEERRAIIAAAVLTEAEEIQLREFASA